MRSAACALIVTALLVLPASSFQYSTFGGKPVRWPAARATVYHDSATITGAYVTELKAALAVWTNVSGSSFQFVHGGASPSANVKDSANGNTDVYFDNLPPLGYAVTMVGTIVSADITERDVAFNQNVSWTTNATNQANGPADFRTVAIHELGHVLGLLHENAKSSVMNTGKDPAFAAHKLEADDVAGVAFLYPGSGPGPGPSEGPDLVVDLVSYSPTSAEPGDEIEISYTMRNAGTFPTGAFSVNLYLTGASSPSPSDAYLGTVTEASLGAGLTRTGRRRVTLPAVLLPGAYRPGVLLDPSGAVADTARGNNGGASAIAVRVERDALEVPAVCRATGRLGPAGRDVFFVPLAAGASFKAKVKQFPGAASLALLAPDTGTPVDASDVGGKAKLKTTVEETGEHRLLLDSHHAGESGYDLKLRLKPWDVEGEATVDGELRVRFRAGRFSRVKVRVKARGELRVEVLVTDVTAKTKVKSSGRKVKIGAYVDPEDVERELVIRPLGVTTGVATYRISVTPTDEGPTFTR